MTNYPKTEEVLSQESERQNRKAALAGIVEHHKKLIEDLGIETSDFQMKFAWNRNGRMVIGIFDNEFRKEKGLYFELVDSYNKPVDPERKVYRVPPNENYAKEYEPYTGKKNNSLSYLVPLEELRIINPVSAAITKSNFINSMDSFFVKNKSSEFIHPIQDALISEMTIRDLYAIIKNKPVSTKDWLNDIIKNNS